jgi:hypothetical protein
MEPLYLNVTPNMSATSRPVSPFRAIREHDPATAKSMPKFNTQGSIERIILALAEDIKE